MSIQVEIPKGWYLAKSIDDNWSLYSERPVMWDAYAKWTISGSSLLKEVSGIKVAGFKGSWKDSLHQWNGQAWEQVK